MNMEDARYTNLALGSINGRVTIDDLNSKVLLTNLVGSKKSGQYTVNGDIDISDKERLNFDVTFEEADVSGVLDMFR